MTKKARLKLIKDIVELRRTPIGEGFAPSEDDIRDELDRMPCRPDAREPDEEFLMFMDEVFEGGQ